MHLYCIDTNIVTKWTKTLEIETRFHMTHSPRSSIGCVQHDFWADGRLDTNRAPFLRQNYHYLQMDSNMLLLEPHHLGVSSGVSNMNSKPVVRSAQTVHQYWTDTNIVSKRTETRFHLTHSPWSSIGCIQDDFSCLWYIRHKPHTSLASKLALSPNGHKQASTWASSARSIIGCV
jgi:hypothetical protein